MDEEKRSPGQTEPVEQKKSQYRGFGHRYRLYDRIKAPVWVFDIVIVVCVVFLIAALIIGIFF